MTLLNPQVPVLQVEDSFRLVYLGSYGVPTINRTPDGHVGMTIGVETVTGPLPKGKFCYDGRDYLGGMEEGQARLVPFDIIRIYWGDPRSVPNQVGRTEDSKGVVGDIAPRDQEVRRLACLYGMYEVNARLLPQAVPQVTITTAEDIEVICPAFDLEGEHIYGYTADTAEVHDVATQLAKMRQQIALLEQQAKAEDTNGKNTGADVEHDAPRRRPA